MSFDAETGRQAAYRRWAFADPAAGTAPARTGFLAKFEREVDPDRRLPAEERERRARRLLRSHMIGLARKRHGRPALRPVEPAAEQPVRPETGSAA